jgi:hypothetical protein
MKPKRLTILITGSRTWDNYKSIQMRMMQAVGELLIDNPTFKGKPLAEYVTVVHGGCPSGADRLADIFARETMKCKVIVYLADWGKWGKRAGMLRNLYMVEKSEADVYLAFIRDKSKGATGCRNAAKKHGIAGETYHYEDELEIYPLPKVKAPNVEA